MVYCGDSYFDVFLLPLLLYSLCHYYGVVEVLASQDLRSQDDGGNGVLVTLLLTDADVAV